MQAIMMFGNLFFRCFPAVKGMANRSSCFQVDHWLLTINTATSLVDTDPHGEQRKGLFLMSTATTATKLSS